MSKCELETMKHIHKERETDSQIKNLILTDRLRDRQQTDRQIETLIQTER